MQSLDIGKILVSVVTVFATVFMVLIFFVCGAITSNQIKEKPKPQLWSTRIKEISVTIGVILFFTFFLGLGGDLLEYISNINGFITALIVFAVPFLFGLFNWD